MFCNAELSESGKDLYKLRETTEAEDAVVTKPMLNLMLTNAEQCWAMLSNAEQHWAMLSNAEQCWAMLSDAENNA